MKQLLFLILFPAYAMAQYPGNAGQKITLGEQTTADGLVYRGVAADTTLTVKSDTAAYFVLDTVNLNLYTYKASASGRKWRQLGADTAAIAYVNTYGTQTVNGAKTFTSAVTATRFNPTANTETGTGMFLPAANTLGFSTNGTNKLTIDASGNLGLGVTPSAWSITPALQVVRASIYNQGDDGTYITSNGYYNAGWKYISNSTATQYQMLSGQHQWFIASSGTAGSAISFTKAMTLDGNGRLGIGVASPTTFLDINSGANPPIIKLTSSAAGQIPFSIRANIPGVSNSGFSIYDETAASSRLVISSTGNVGIGTASPTARLQVKGSANTFEFALRVEDSGSNNLLSVQNNGAATFSSSVNVGGVSSNTDFRIYRTVAPNVFFSITAPGGTPNASTLGVNGTNVMVLNASGNVGIGVTPSAWSVGGVLQVANTTGTQPIASSGIYNALSANLYYNAGWKYATTGNALLYSQEAGVHAWYNAISGTADNTVTLTRAMTLDASGNLAIGSSTAAYSKLELIGNAQNYANSPSVTFTDTAGYADSRRWMIGNIATNYGSFNIASSTTPTGNPTTPRLTINRSGNVGIGATNPQTTLEINGGNTYFPSKIVTLSGAENTRYNGFIGLNLINGSQIGMSFGTRSNNIEYNNTLNLYNGNVGIGTNSPNNILQITAAAGLSFARWTESATTVGFVGGANGIIQDLNGSFAVRGENGLVLSGAGNAANLYINSSGKVGIGTTSPQSGYRLHVVDSVYVGGNVSASAYTTRSDYDLKDEIQNISYGINEVMQMQPVKYTYKSNGSTQLGFIAQDLGVITPEVVSFEDKMSVYYNALIPILTKAIQEQNAFIKALEQRLLILENK